MTDLDLDRRLAGWFADTVPMRAPDRLLGDVLDVVDRTSQRAPLDAGPLGRVLAGWRARGRVGRLALVGLVLVALSGAAVAGALLLRALEDHSPALVLVRYRVPEEPAAGVVVLEQRGDVLRQVAQLDTVGLDGIWDGREATLGPTGLLALGVQGDAGEHLVIVDPRGRVEPRRLDRLGTPVTWAPDGTRIGGGDETGLFVYDLSTGELVRSSIDDPLVTLDGGIVWAADGSGFLSDPGVETIGVVRLDGTFVPGRVPRFDPGLGPRRVRADGTLLRCRVTSDSHCEPGDRSLLAVGGPPTPIWTTDDPTLRISDFAWSEEGGMWILTATGDGPSTALVLRHVDPQGTESVVAAFAVPEPEDPAGSCPPGRFVAMAPDDSSLVVTLGCTEPELRLVDVAAGTSTPIEGVVAGWRTGEDDELPYLAAPKPVPEAVRGDWGGRPQTVSGGRLGEPRWLTITPTRLLVRLPEGASYEATLGLDAEDRIEVRPATGDTGCPDDAPAIYDWEVSGRDLTLAAIADVCADRRALLEGTYERALPLAGNSEPVAEAGTTYYLAAFGVRVTIPTEGRTTVWSREPEAVQLATEGAHWVFERAPLLDAAGGLTGAEAGLVPGTALTDVISTTVTGRPALTGTLVLTGASVVHTSSIWGGEGGGFTLREGSRVTLIEGPDGAIYSVVAWSERPSPQARAWGDALTASLSFDAD
jgi:hypothetical protein